MLTDRFIRNARPGTYADEGGLYLRVHAAGTKSWVVRDRRNGGDKWITLGEYPALGLAEAREQAKEIKNGTLAVTLTVEEAYARWYQHIHQDYAHPEEIARMFRSYILPDHGKTPLHKLTRPAITETLQKIVERGARVMANRTFAKVRQFLDFCEHRGYLPHNPVASVKRKHIGGKETPRERHLSWEEIERFLRLLRTKNKVSPGTRWALYMILLTGKRASEVLSFGRVENGRLVGPGKTRPYAVPLTPHVRAGMKLRPKVVPADHRVLSKALLRLEQTFTPHDLRRTFSSRLADLGVAPHVIEKLLDHQMEGVMAVYNRAEYWPERVAAMRLWGHKLASLRRKKNPPGV